MILKLDVGRAGVVHVVLPAPAEKKARGSWAQAWFPPWPARRPQKMGRSISSVRTGATSLAFLGCALILVSSVSLIMQAREHGALFTGSAQPTQACSIGGAPAKPAVADVAVVLIGGLRQFECTWPSIAKLVLGLNYDPSTTTATGEEGDQGGHSFAPYNSSDLFLVSPFDQSTWKLASLLRYAQHSAQAGRHISIDIIHDFTQNETAYPVDMLCIGTGNGAQGLLHQFLMEDIALNRVQDRERVRGIPYKWVLKSRPDAYWSSPPPSMPTLAKIIADRVRGNKTLTAGRTAVIPFGSDWGGYNDRLAIGPSAAMGPMFSRLHQLWPVHNMWRNFVDQHQKDKGNEWMNALLAERPRNAERVLLRILDIIENVGVARGIFRFCVLSHHIRFIRAMSQPDPLEGGEYCRPCRIEHPTKPGWCKVTGPWEDDWNLAFDSAAGPDIAEQRKHVDGLTVEQCTEELSQLQAIASGCNGQWSSPPAAAICARKLLGVSTRLRAPSMPFTEWPIALQQVKEFCTKATCIGYSISGPLPEEKGAAVPHLVWDLLLQCRLKGIGTSVAKSGQPSFWHFLFSPETPGNTTQALKSADAALRKANDTKLCDGFKFVPKTLPPAATDTKVSVVQAPFDVAQLMHENGHKKLALLKIDSDVDRYVRAWFLKRDPPKTCQLLLNMGSPHENSLNSARGWIQLHEQEEFELAHVVSMAITPGIIDWQVMVRMLRELGFELDQCTGESSETHGRCLFFHQKYCST